MNSIFQELVLDSDNPNLKVIVKLNNYEKRTQYKDSGYKWNPEEKYWFKNYFLNFFYWDSQYPNKFDQQFDNLIYEISMDKNIDKDILEMFLRQLRKSVQLIPAIEFKCKKENDGKVSIDINIPNLPDKMMKQYGYIWSN